MGTSKEQQAKAGEMLEEMIKSTHRLDEILQHMCTAEPQEKGPVIHAAADLENVDTQDTESEEEFQDCIAVATSATSSTPEEYFQSVRNAFGDGTIEIPAAAVDIQRLQSSLHGTGDLAVRFATCTRDTSFVFSSAGSDGPWKSVAASPQPEYGVSYSHFLSQLRQQIVACDHIVPVERADAAAELSFLLLEEQQRRLLGAINSYFPYQREAIYWAQGNRVCEMFVQETQQDNQWGLLIQSNVTSVLRARVNKQPEELPAQDPNMDRDTSVSSCTRCMVFLPKTHYLRSSARVAFQVSIAISLAITEAGADVKISSSRKEDKPEGRASPSSDARTKDISDAAGTRTIPLTAELPEILSVAEWGTHDDNPILEDKNFVHPAREQTTTGTFRKVRIETPFPRNRIVQAACSRFHTLFLNDMGLVFAYGHTVDGALGLGYELRGYLAQPTLVDYFFDNLIVVQDISCGGDQLVGAHSAALVNSGQRAEGVTDNQAIAELGTHSVEHVMCGGRQTIALTSGSFLARSMNKLYHESIGRGEEDHTSAIAGADLVLIVSGQRIPAHKLLLAQRSPILRELILEEEEQQQNRRNRREDDGGNSTHSRSEPLELLLPRLRADIARALVEFVYTDNFTMEVSKNAYYLVNDVLRAAKLYKLPSLAQLCRERLFSASPSSLFGGGVEALAGLEEIAEQDEKFSDKNSEDDPHKQVEIPGGSARTLNDDMKFALSDEVWADTVLIAEGHRIPVHRCMLVARSEYFRAVLAFRRSSTHLTTEAQVSNAMAVVNVEDSYAGIVRVLRFIYYDQVVLPSLNRKDAKGDSDGVEQEAERAEGAVNDYLAEEASDQLLEDLVAADKYRLERMKRLCEHAICVTVANCLEVLAVAELVHAAHLKQVAMRFVQTHLAQITAREEEFRRFQKDFPPLLEELYASLRDASREEFLLREWNKDVGASLAAQREEQELQWGKKSAAATFPWVPLSLAVAFGAMYLSLMHAQEHEFTAVPATNLIAIAAICGAIMTGYL
ncbi:BTB/POZ and MATH domain-containing protein 2 [Phytophthora ramorum]|uniref:BTB/POZ and MATH domain-containing protein 2 n=1 Tax=Phytophthora ramorum TaxID=164328 RepID=UPI00309B7705|nr:BTB/POZ and MATH domain-containing protein 2 [Phytophthora ramorum]